MPLDCYDFYLWSIGEITLSPRLVRDLIHQI